jgi:fibronectin type 3 domain-containing protein
LNPNTTYYYEVMATSGTESSALSSYVSGTTAPATPTGLAVNSPTSTTLTVSWNSSSGATGYLLYRSSSASGTYSQIYSGNVTSYMDGSGTVLTPYTTYYYEVMAINGTASSALSSYVSGTTTPATPTGLAVSSPTSTTLTLSWNTSAGATGYQLYRSTSASGTYSDVYSGTATSDQDGSLNTGATYYYEVVATNGSLSSAPSSVVSGTTLPVAPNTPVLVASTPRQITVNWTVTTGAATYNLYYKATSQVTTSSYDAEVTGLTGTSTTVSSLADDTTYYFILTGVNATGGEGAASAAGLSATTAPAPPTGLTVSNRGLTSITLTWTPGAGASTYNLYYNAGTTVSSSNSKIAGVSSGYTISPLTAATQYSFAATSADATSRESVLSTPATTSTITQATLYPNSTGSVVEGYTGNPTTNLSSQFLSSNEFAIVYFDTSSLTGHSILNGYLSTGVWGMVWDPSLNLQVDEIASSWSGISSVTWAETGSYSKSSSSTVGTAAYYTNTAVSIDVTSIVNDWANTSNGGAFIQTGPYSYDYLTLQPYGYSTYLTVEY